jgi:hypothetical protein
MDTCLLFAVFVSYSKIFQGADPFSAKLQQVCTNNFQRPIKLAVPDRQRPVDINTYHGVSLLFCFSVSCVRRLTCHRTRLPVSIVALFWAQEFGDCGQAGEFQAAFRSDV